MSKTMLSALVIVGLVVGGYFLLSSKKVENPEDTGVVKGEETGKKMAFSEFLKQGGAYKCEVKQAMSDFENSGTMYVSGGNIRGEFSTIAEGKPMETSFIMKDGYSYTWSSALPNMGFKVKVPENTEVNTNYESYGWNADQIGDYNCEAWAVDESKFAVPAGITFTELGNK